MPKYIPTSIVQCQCCMKHVEGEEASICPRCNRIRCVECETTYESEIGCCGMCEQEFHAINTEELHRQIQEDLKGIR